MIPTIPEGGFVPVRGLHHWAYRCKDAEETRSFYEDLLGLPLTHIVQADTVPSTGEYCPYVHLFFRMKDGSYIAFFDLGDDTSAEPSPNTPTWVNHLAMRVDSVAELEKFKERLEQHGIQIQGVIDHGFVKSIYFMDPNGVRLEFTTDTVDAESVKRFEEEAHEKLDVWTAQKRRQRDG